MVQVAVKSALYFNTLKPYCMWSGNTSVPIYRFLVSGESDVNYILFWAFIFVKHFASYQVLATFTALHIGAVLKVISAS